MRSALCSTLTAAALLVGLPATAQETDLDPDVRRVVVHDDDGRRWKLARVSYEAVVDATPDEAWDLLADYGAVHLVSGGIVDSDYIGSAQLGEGCQRYCQIDFNGRDVYVEERIIEFADGDHYTYDVYEWRNFPLKKMHVTFGVRTDDAGRTVVYNLVDYKLKPGIMTGPMRGTMRGTARTGVLGYKHYLETGEGDQDAKRLKKLYARR